MVGKSSRVVGMWSVSQSNFFTITALQHDNFWVISSPRQHRITQVPCMNQRAVFFCCFLLLFTTANPKIHAFPLRSVSSLIPFKPCFTHNPLIRCDEGVVLETASTSERRRLPWVAINPVDTFWSNNWCLARHNSCGKLIIFSSRETRSASRETGIASRETGIASREAGIASRETRFQSYSTAQR